MGAGYAFAVTRIGDIDDGADDIFEVGAQFCEGAFDKSPVRFLALLVCLAVVVRWLRAGTGNVDVVADTYRALVAKFLSEGVTGEYIFARYLDRLIGDA